MSKKRKFLLGSLGLVLALVLCDVWLYYFHVPGWKPAFESTSPDGYFTVSVYDNPGIIFLPSGLHPRGSAGTVVLRENKTGKVLQRAIAEKGVNAGKKTPHVDWFPKTNAAVASPTTVKRFSSSNWPKYHRTNRLYVAHHRSIDSEMLLHAT